MDSIRFGISDAAKYLDKQLKIYNNKNYDSLVTRNIGNFNSLLKNIEKCPEKTAKVVLAKMCYHNFCEKISSSNLPNEIKTLTRNVLHTRHCVWFKNLQNV